MNSTTLTLKLAENICKRPSCGNRHKQDDDGDADDYNEDEDDY